MGDTVETRRIAGVEALFPAKALDTAGVPVRRAEVGNYQIDFRAAGPVLALVFEAEPDAEAQQARGAADLNGLAEAGCSILHVTPRTPDWYRGPALHRWFGSVQGAAFLAGFENAVFIGASMGGFAAITFSRLRPGALVIAHHPQSTLAKSLVPRETRFAPARALDWSGAFADAAEGAALARRIYISYDPFLAADKRHVDRLPGKNIVHLKLPFLGHQSSLALDQLKITRKVTAMALAETLDEYEFARLTRDRRKLPQYYRNAALVLKKRKHLDALLFDAARRDDTDPQIYRDAVVRMFERGIDRKGLEHYYGRLSLSQKLPSQVQGILRATVGMVEQRNDPGKFEPKLRKDRAARMEKLAQAIDYESANVRELLVSAKFMRSMKRWRSVERLAQAAVKLDPKQGGARQMVAEAQKQIMKAETPLTAGQKFRKFFADLW